MSEPFIAEIRIFPFNFAPRGWAQCNGQLLPIAQNTALFSLVGTIYGGDGRATFALPNLQDATAMFWGQGSGLQDRVIGQRGGQSAVTLSQANLPAHTHALRGRAGPSQSGNPAGGVPATGSYVQGTQFGVVQEYSASNSAVVNMNSQALAVSGSGQPHNNMQPYLTLNYCIALVGIFPSRN